MVEVARRQFIMQRDMDLSKENMYLNLIQGIAVDNGGNIQYNWADEFDHTIPAEVDFDRDNAAPAHGVIRTACTTAVRSIRLRLKGLGGPKLRISPVACCARGRAPRGERGW